MYSALVHIKNYLRWYVLFLLMFISIVLWIVVFQESQQGRLIVSFLNVSGGQSIFIQSPSGNTALIDAGENKDIMKEINTVLPWYKRKINVLVATSPNISSYEGFIPLLDTYSADVLVTSNATSTTQVYALFEQTLQNKKIPQVIGQKGETINLGNGVTLSIIFSDGSLVSRLSYRNTDILFSEDATSGTLDYLTSTEGQNLQSDIVVVGNEAMLNQNFLQAVSPEYTIVLFDPNKESKIEKANLTTLQGLNLKTLNIFELGNITFVSDGKSFEKK